MSSFFDLSGDYYNYSAGYVIDGKQFRNADDAHRYLMKVGCEVDDAQNYLDLLERAFHSRRQAMRRRTAVAMPV